MALFLEQLLPFLKLKLNTAKLVLKIVQKLKTVNSRSDFYEVCLLVDKIAELTDSKKRTITSNTVLSYFNSPVETWGTTPDA